MSINATPGDPAADSYADVAYADSYFIDSRNATWVALASDTKESLLKQATRLLDRFFDWSGDIKKDSTQALRWPRENAYDMDNRLIDSTIVPDKVKQATVEWAYLLNTSSFDVSTNPLHVAKIGSIRLEFRDGVDQSTFPKMVVEILSPIGSLRTTSVSGVGQAKLVRT